MTRNMHVYSKFTDMFNYLIKGTYVLRKLLFLMVLLTVGATSTWADDLSGTYYIGSNGWSSGNNDNYYLCPTEGWCYYKATDDFTSDVNNTPFLTTYQVKKKAGYDKSKAIWIVEKHPTQDCYYIKNAIDGRYIVFNGKIQTTSNEDRMRVHLDPTPNGNRALFRFTKISDNKYNIRPHEDYSNRWWTVNGGNKDALTGQGGKGNANNNIGNKMIEMNILDKNGKKIRKQLEVDFVCNKGSKRFYIQSAYALPDKEKMEQEQRSLVNTGDGFKKIIITKDAVAPLYNDEGILVMSVYDFLLNPDSMEI